MVGSGRNGGPYASVADAGTTQGSGMGMDGMGMYGGGIGSYGGGYRSLPMGSNGGGMPAHAAVL
ncbi:MAG TPA: hypothetical protein VFV77_03695 [Gammaproteobacteria bacterium]|nr:hypothetical protein [Gammaproteobacteria bacterium]